MDPSTGRFTTMDSYLGRIQDPTSLHKYLYAHSNPVNYTDPSGYLTLAEQSTASSISGIIAGIYNQASAMALNLFQNLMTTRSGEVVIEVALEMLPLLFYEDVTLKDIAMAFIGGLIGAALNVDWNTESARQVIEKTTRVRHYTNRKGINGIEQDGKIIARDNNRVYVEPANKKPLSQIEAETKYQIKKGKGRDYVEFDVPDSMLEWIKNPRYGTEELTIKGGVEKLINPVFKRRK